MAQDPSKGSLGVPIGSQTWPHRATLREDFPAVLKSLAAIGVQEIEMCSPFGYAHFAALAKGTEVRRVIADHGLECRSSHFMIDELRQSQERSIAWAHDVGITQMFVPSLEAGLNPTLDDVKRAADEYNRMAAAASRAGMRQGLHNEGFETTAVDGKRTYDILFDLLDPALITFQFQMSTIREGFDAVEYFGKHPGRFSSIHLQDWDPAAQKTVAIGEGVIDWKKVFAAAGTAGVTSCFVELDLAATQRSVAFLKSLGRLG